MQTFIRCLVPLAIACGAEMTNNPTIDASVSGDGTTMQIDAALEPVVPEVLVSNESDLASLDVYLGAIYWTTDPFTGKGQVKKLMPGGQTQVLAAQEDHPISIDVGPGFIDDTAFWGLNYLLGQVRQIATTGAPPLSSINVNDSVYCLTLDAERVFIGTRSAVMSKHVTNTGGLTTLASGYANGVLSIDADANSVVFGARTTSGNWIVASVARSGGTVTTLYTGSQPIRDITIAGTDVVWLETSKVMRVPRAGGAEAVVTTITNSTPWRLATANDKLFVAAAAMDGKIVEVDLASGTQTELATDQPEPRDIAVDADYVYWANRGLGDGTGTILRLKR